MLQDTLHANPPSLEQHAVEGCGVSPAYDVLQDLVSAPRPDSYPAEAENETELRDTFPTGADGSL